MTDDELIARDELLYGFACWETRPDGTRARIDPKNLRRDPRTGELTLTLPGKVETIDFTVKVDP